jgi:pimeloyl-ACP methyl ester carboxylesterase
MFPCLSESWFIINHDFAPASGDGRITLYSDTASLTLNYRRWAASSDTQRGSTPPFLLLHGLASALRIWDFTAPYLVQATGATVWALDQRGHGLSDKPAQGYTNTQIAGDDYAAATLWNLNPAVVVGHSWGASIALTYAATYPEHVRAVVLVDGGMGDLQDRPDATWETISAQLAPPDFAGTPRQEFLNFFRHSSNWRYFEPIWSPALEDVLLNIVELRADDTVGPRLSRANHMQILRSMWETRNVIIAERVTCPVLMISAETPESADWGQQKREGAARLKTALTKSPRVTFLTMPQTVHDIPLQRPAELSQAIVDFLAETDVSSPIASEK